MDKLLFAPKESFFHAPSELKLLNYYSRVSEKGTFLLCFFNKTCDKKIADTKSSALKEFDILPKATAHNEIFLLLNILLLFIILKYAKYFYTLLRRPSLKVKSILLSALSQSKFFITSNLRISQIMNCDYWDRRRRKLDLINLGPMITMVAKEYRFCFGFFTFLFLAVTLLTKLLSKCR